MLIIKTFCLCCSVRLGSLIIGIFTLIEASLCLMYTVTRYESLKRLNEDLIELLTTIKLDYEFLYDIANNPKWAVIILIVFFALLLTACILLLYGAIKCKSSYLYPFIVLYLIYIAIIMVGEYVFMVWLKVVHDSVSEFILLTNLFTISLVFYLYTWMCVYSFWKIIEQLRRRLLDKFANVERIRNKIERF